MEMYQLHFPFQIKSNNSLLFYSAQGHSIALILPHSALLSLRSLIKHLISGGIFYGKNLFRIFSEKQIFALFISICNLVGLVWLEAWYGMVWKLAGQSPCRPRSLGAPSSAAPSPPSGSSPPASAASEPISIKKIRDGSKRKFRASKNNWRDRVCCRVVNGITTPRSYA